MKTKNSNNSGFATIELLIAFAILLINITGVLLLNTSVSSKDAGTGKLISQGQVVSIKSETAQEALYAAEKQLEDSKITVRTDFNSLNTTSPQSFLSGALTYTKNFNVTDLTSCKKLAKSKVSWNVPSSPSQSVELSTLFTDIAGALALGGDCELEELSEWDNPITGTSVAIGGQGATDIDVKNNFIYLTSAASAEAKDDLFIYEFNPTSITLTEKSKVSVSKGLNNIDTISGYAFSTNNEKTEHLKVFDIANPTNPSLVASVSLPNMTQGIARSIVYYNGFVYIGTQYLACPSCSPQQNNEFHIFEVSTPSTPTWRGSFKVNHNINDIVVRGNYAYLATSDDTGEVRIYNISNPSNVSFVGLFDPSGNEDGQVLYLIGNKLYLGRDRTPSARKDFYVIDISNPSTPTELGSKNLGLNSGTTVVGLVVRESLAFLGIDNPTSGIEILNISDPTNITAHPVCTSLNFSENSTAIDMDDNFIFSANNSNDEIRVIQDQTSICS